MAPKPTGCFEWLSVSKIATPRESGKSATFSNPAREEILLVHADKRCRKGLADCPDCFFEADQKVADYIVCNPKVIDVIVELKGTDLLGAVEQIEVTVSTWRTHHRCSGKIGALIVSSKGASHPNVAAKLLVKQEKLRRQGIRLKHTANPNPEFDFSSFVG
jgi:hypothetical protein